MTRDRFVAVALVLTLWCLMRAVFWQGFGGADDLLYANYAHSFDHLPEHFWQYRMPGILAIRAALLAFGPSEFVICLPSLVASLIILLSVAWIVGWPRTLNWQTNVSVVLACVMPTDVTRASIAVVSVVSAGFLALGTACMLKGSRKTQYVGAVFLALGFETHEIAFFYVAIFCLTAIAFDWRRYWKPVLACVCIAGGLVLLESVVYWWFTGENFARLRAAGAAASSPTNYHKRFGGSALLFHLWPLQILVFCKDFGFDLILLLVCGAVAWRRLDRTQRILFLTVFLYWFWLGYGTQVPWAYRPRSRCFHYYIYLTLGICALLPLVVDLAFARRRRIAHILLSVAVFVHVACLAGGGRWGQRVDVSRELLVYAQSYPERRFLTDARTLKEMYFVNGFRAPENVECLDSPVARREHFVGSHDAAEDSQALAVKVPVDAILINHERIENPPKKEFAEFINRHRGERIWRSPVRYKLAFAPLIPIIGHFDFAVKSLGGEVVAIEQ